MKMLLRINENPQITSYAHHAFTNAIISANAIPEGKSNNSDSVLMDANIENMSNYDWRLLHSNNAVIVNENHLLISKAGIGDNSECVFYRTCFLEDDLVIRFVELQNTASGAIVNLFVSDDNIEQCILNNYGIVRYGMMNNQLLIRVNNDFKSFHEINTSEYKWMRLTKNINSIVCSISCDGLLWKTVDVITDFKISNKCFIGINANNLGSGYLQQYEAWLAMNYIQLFENTQDPIGKIWLDYKMFPYKNFRYEYGYACNFMDVDYVSTSFIENVFDSPINAIKKYIMDGYYVAFPIDEYYIKGRPAYGERHYVHHNLIYGFEDENEMIYLLGYDRKLNNSSVSFDIIKKSYKACESSIIKYKYNPCIINYKFSVHAFLDSLLDFINSNNSMLRFAGTICDHPGVYGIKALESFCEKEEHRKLLLEDYRVSYIIYEHTLLMKWRLDYICKKILVDTDFSDIIEKINFQIKKIGTIKNMILKNSISHNVMDYREQIFNQYSQFISAEKELFNDIINKIKMYTSI